MQQLTTVYQKYVTKNPQSVNPPFSKLWEIALPTPFRIDAPASTYEILEILQSTNLIDIAYNQATGAQTSQKDMCCIFPKSKKFQKRALLHTRNILGSAFGPLGPRPLHWRLCRGGNALLAYTKSWHFTDILLSCHHNCCLRTVSIPCSQYDNERSVEL